MAETQTKKKEEQELVTILYHGTRLVTYAGHTWEEGSKTKGVDGKKYDPTEVKRRGGADNHGSVYRFKPGINILPKAMWEEMLAPGEAVDPKDKNKKTAGDISMFASMVDSGELEVYDPTIKKGEEDKKPKTPGLADDMAPYSNKDAINLIENCMNLEQLTKWKKSLSSDRPQVAEAIIKQIQVLTGLDGQEQAQQ